MPLQNRVGPLGELVAAPGRGLVYGNRGCLHDREGRIRRGHNGKRWIACRLEFRGWRRTALLQPGRFTELFFLDEATALAAGHRPCALCRREDYNRFLAFWRDLHPGQLGADTIDAQLHRERLVPSGRSRRLHDADIAELPEGAYVLHRSEPWVVAGVHLFRWGPGGYAGRLRRPTHGRTTLITPPSLVALLAAGWEPAVPFLHPSALAAGSVAATREGSSG